MQKIVAVAFAVQVAMSLGCAAAPEDEQSSRSDNGAFVPPVQESEATTSTGDTVQTEDQVRIHWSSFDAATQRHTTNSKLITKKEVQWLLAARTAARSKTVKEVGSVERVQQAVTATSLDWTNCQWTEWLLMTAGSNGTGDIVCARFESGLPYHGPAQIPFVPAWVDASTSFDSILCNATLGCQKYECSLGPAVRLQVPRATGSQNVFPPADTRYVFVGPVQPC